MQRKKKESHSVKSARRRHFADAKILGENGAKNCQVPKGLEMIEKIMNEKLTKMFEIFPKNIQEVFMTDEKC
jgi:hypothetical protein